MSDEKFLLEYEKLLDKGYCDCNEMNCLDNDTPRKILNIVKGAKLEAKQLLIENKQLKEQLQQKEDIINKAIEELYIWGEILNPEFQKRMLEILEKSDSNE